VSEALTPGLVRLIGVCGWNGERGIQREHHLLTVFFPQSDGSTAAGECVNWKGAIRMKYVGKRLRARNT